MNQSAISMTKRKSGFVNDQNPVPIGTPTNEMMSSPLHPGKQASDVSSLPDLYKGDAYGSDWSFSTNGYGGWFGQIIHNVWY